MSSLRFASWEPHRLRWAREERGWTVSYLAQAVRIKEDLLKSYLYKRIAPPPALLVRFARTLQVATVDLAPLSERPTLHELRWHAGLTVVELGDHLNLGRTSTAMQARGQRPISKPDEWCAILTTIDIEVTPALLRDAWEASRDTDQTHKRLVGQDLSNRGPGRQR